MHIETIRTQFIDLLSEHFDVHSVKASPVDSTLIRNLDLRNQDIVSIECVVNNRIRLHIYALNRDGVVLFTRPKEGIAQYIIRELRHYDFYFKLNNQISSHNNLISRIIDTYLGWLAAEDIKETLGNLFKTSQNKFQYCFGYKVTHNHRYTKSYDAEFEVLINKGDRHHIYYITIMNGVIHDVKDEKGETLLMENLFEV